VDSFHIFERDGNLSTKSLKKLNNQVQEGGESEHVREEEYYRQFNPRRKKMASATEMTLAHMLQKKSQNRGRPTRNGRYYNRSKKSRKKKTSMLYPEVRMGNFFQDKNTAKNRKKRGGAKMGSGLVTKTKLL